MNFWCFLGVVLKKNPLECPTMRFLEGLYRNDTPQIGLKTD